MPKTLIVEIIRAILLIVLYYSLQFSVLIPIGFLDRLGIFLDPISVGLAGRMVAWPITIWYALRNEKIDFRDVFGVSKMSMRTALIIVLTAIGAAICFGEIGRLLPYSKNFADRVSGVIADGNKVSLLISFAFVAPLFEECFFRGIVLRKYLQRFSIIQSLLASSFLFAGFHVAPWQALIALPYGFLFGWLFIQTKSLLSCILCHSTINLSLLILIGPLRRMCASIDIFEHVGGVSIILILVGAGGVFAGIFLLANDTMTPTQA